MTKTPRHAAGFFLYDIISVLHFNTFAAKQRIANKLSAVKIFTVHIDARYLMVFVGGIIVNSLVGITAGGVNGDLVLPLPYITAAALLIYAAEYVEKLADTFALAAAGNGIHFSKRHPYKA